MSQLTLWGLIGPIKSTGNFQSHHSHHVATFAPPCCDSVMLTTHYSSVEALLAQPVMDLLVAGVKPKHPVPLDFRKLRANPPAVQAIDKLLSPPKFLARPALRPGCFERLR